MYCPNCGKEVSPSSRFCGNCREPMFEHRHRVEEIKKEEKEDTVGYNIPAFWISIVSVALGFLAFVVEITYIGITVGVTSLIMIIIALIKNKKNQVRNSRNIYTLTLSIVGIITNTMWLIFITTILPYM